MLGYTLNYIGRFQEAFDALIRVPALGNRTGWPLAKRSAALAGLGRYDDVRRVLDEMLARNAVEYMNPDAIACACQLLGRNDEAFQWLELAAATQTGWAGCVGVDALFAPLRKDSRFDAFCERLRIPVHPLPPNAIGDLRPPS